jgi:flagellar biosynthesis regulator FlaF
MDATISDDHNAYYNLSELSEALNQKHGSMISRSTLSRMVTKGLLKPDLTTSKEVLFLKSRLPEIAETINNMRQSKSQEYQEIVKEEQQPQPPPQIEPIVITQAPEQKQIPDITALDLTKQILARLTALEKQYQDQQLEIHNVKMQIVDLETELNNKIKDLEKEETNDYDHLIDVINKKIDSINAFKEYLKHVDLKLQSLEEELDQFESEYIRRYGY